jgi:hypothetical protein
VKYCPNPDCPYARRHGESQEYRDEALTCVDCGAELVSEKPVWTAEATRPPEIAWGRVALTVAVPLVLAWLAPRVPLPNVDRESLERVLAYPTAMPDLSAFALGLFPMFTAALLVELAALCVPRWRALRRSSVRESRAWREASTSARSGSSSPP